MKLRRCICSWLIIERLGDRGLYGLVLIAEPDIYFLFQRLRKPFILVQYRVVLVRYEDIRDHLCWDDGIFVMILPIITKSSSVDSVLLRRSLPS